MYNKLFTKILDSSIWLEPTPTRVIWITMLAAMDEHGFVQFASIPNLAHRAILSIPETEEAVKVLESPDPNSSDPDNEGRRIERVPGGWMILNSAKYRVMVNRVVIQEQTRERVRRHREKKAGNVPETACNAAVTPSEAVAEAGSGAKAEATPTLPAPASPSGKNGSSRLPTSREAVAIAELYSRRLTTEWSEKEIKAYKALHPIDPSELELVIAYTQAQMAKGDKGIHRRDILTFLNNFRGEVDRARAKKGSGEKRENIKVPIIKAV